MRTEVFIVFTTYLFFYFLVETVKTRYAISAEYTRKFAHIISGLGAVYFSTILTKGEFILLAFLFLIIFAASYKHKFFKSIHLKRRTYGEILYPVSLILLAVFLYEQRILFIIGILLLALSDAAAGLSGRVVDKDKKTNIGSFVFFAVSFIILLFGFGYLYALAVAMFLTLVERYSLYGLDNLTVPVAYLVMFATLT